MEQGSALIEFGLIAFMFIITLLGVVELGRMVLVYNTLANAARAGVRYAIVHGGDLTSGGSGPGNTAQVQTVVENFASAGLLNTNSLTVTVTYPNGINTAGGLVSVAVSYPYDPLVGYFSSTLNVTMGSTSEGVIAF